MVTFVIGFEAQTQTLQQLHTKFIDHVNVLLSRFHLNGHTIGFGAQTQILPLHYMAPSFTLRVNLLPVKT